jgi:adenosylcobinamide-GDP ribazoletransferase
MAFAPAVGLLLGAAAAVVLAAADRLLHAPLVAAALAIATLAVLTRALHLDGLADLADGLGSGKPAPGALEVMKRSDIGPFGVVTLVLTLLAQVAGLAAAQQHGHGPAAAAAAVTTGRLAISWACRRGVRPARPEGLGALVAGTLPLPVPAGLTAAVLGLAGLAAWLLPARTGSWLLPAAAAAGLAAGLALSWHASRRLGGITGDVLGAIAEVATATCLVVSAAS